MEKRLPLKTRRTLPELRNLLSLRILLIILLFLPVSFPCADLHAQTLELSHLIRIQLWVPAEEEPSHSSSSGNEETPYLQAVQNLKSIAPFMLEGMLYGWNVTYAPSDAARQISEFYECTPVTELSPDDPAIQWMESEITDTSVSCWIDYYRSDAQMQYKKWWNSVNIVKVQGKGSASISLGPDGIKQAVTDAAKTAVRTYLQKVEKNKPKEMTGSILLSDGSPRIYIDHGQYVADLDFFLYVDRIEKYSYY